jgi:hypothetical protein
VGSPVPERELSHRTKTGEKSWLDRRMKEKKKTETETETETEIVDFIKKRETVCAWALLL